MSSAHSLEQLRSGQLDGCRRLNLRGHLQELPPEVFDLAESLEVLDLTGNQLSSLPHGLPRLHKLKVLFASSNEFTVLPEVLGKCRNLQMIGFRANRIRHVPASSLPPQLRWLILTENQLTEIPEVIGQCQALQKLMLSGNRLRSLPESLADCHRLELLRLAANNFTTLPEWLPAMPRLAWLAFAGNPVSPTPSTGHGTLPRVPWQNLEIGELLGEGASGRISRAHWRVTAQEAGRSGAVKVFKGAMTSDGLPDHEMAAALAAGSHECLIEVVGVIEQHPEQAQALLMALLEDGFVNLAGPPSLETCCRDVYAEGKCLSLSAMLRLLTGVASVMAHLHERGIMHGDLYAHNILHKDDGSCVLSDFGAATFLPQEGKHRERLQRMEVLAFGILLGELLDRLDAPLETEQRHIRELRSLERDCSAADVSSRPDFRAILNRLERSA